MSGRVPTPAAVAARAAGLREEDVAPLMKAYLAGFRLEDAARFVGTSVRFGPGGAAGRRLLLEQASPGVLVEVCRLFGRRVARALGEVAVHAARRRLAFMTGWDWSRQGPVLKAYLNAGLSDAAGRRSALGELLRRLGAPPLPEGAAPHILGVNHDGERATVKLYLEYPRLRAAARAAGPGARTLARLVERAGRAAGGELVLEARGSGWARRAFVAGVADGELLDGDDPLAAPLLAQAGAAADALRGARACGPARLTFVSTSLGEAPAYTAYFSPALLGARPPEPTPPEDGLGAQACFAAGAAKVRLIVEPARAGRRAYASAAGRDLSYHLGEARPGAGELEALMAWASAGLRGRPFRGRPPRPWRRLPD